MGKTFFFQWEVSLMVWLQDHLGTVGEKVAEFFTMFGGEAVLVAIVGMLYWGLDKKTGRKIGLSLLLSFTLGTMIKNILVRRRPYFDHKDIACLKPVSKGADIYDISAQGFSMPSGHSTNSAAVFGGIAAQKRKPWLTVLGIGLPLAVGISRVCLGVHYPTDVLMGWALGSAVMLLAAVLDEKVQNRVLLTCGLLLVTLPGFFWCSSDDYYTGMGLMTGFLLSEFFEERFVRFANTRNILRCVLRILGGVLIFFGLNTLMKLPFSAEFLDSGSFGAHLARSLRYAITIFVDFGIYPLVFRAGDRFFVKEGGKNADDLTEKC